MVAGPVAIITLVIACQGNGPGANAQTGLFCDASRLGCQDTPEPGDILYWRWPGTRFPDGSTTHGTSPAGTTCLGPDQAAAIAVIPVMTLADFRRLPLPPGTTTVEPGTGRVLINVPTNVYATAEPLVLQTTLIGQPVTVRATPASYTWDFGDGATLGPTTDPGAAYPAMTTTHTYTAPGDHSITLTTAYAGEYAVNGGPYQPIDGQAEVTTAPVPLAALAGRNHLVADTLTS